MRMRTSRHLRTALLGSTLLATAPAQAVNWLLLQGTEAPGAADRVRLWGFIQPEYQQTDGSELRAGPWAGQDAQFNVIAPDLDTHAQFNLRRARFGVRGTALPIDDNVNYFLLVEAGNNGITKPGGGAGSLKLTDASITLNHFKGATRIRVGEFKTPSAEEGLKAIHVFDYINFTTVTNQLLLERHFAHDGSDPAAGANPQVQPVGAFRDVGVQWFESFKVGDWDHSYAVMIGNGNGIEFSDNNSGKDIYLYWSSERLFGGKGPRAEGWKLFAWHQQGKRSLIAGATQTEQDFDRTRWGLGTTWRQDRLRAGAEYIAADGMIFNGTDGGAVAGATNNAGTGVASFNVLPEDQADGWYLDIGYLILPNLELDLRYDVLNRATDSAAAERRFDTLTLGAQYFVNKKVRLLVNYEIRDAEAPGLAGSAVPNQILDGVDDVLSVQLLAVF